MTLLEVVVIVLAIICFLIATVGVNTGKINIIALGLFLLSLSFLIP